MDTKPVGYHYTSWTNWEKIKKEGLIPYPMTNHEVTRVVGNGLKGIWIWQERLDPLAHAGAILHQLAMKADPKVVRLSVRFDWWTDTLFEGPLMVSVGHDGTIEKFQYHWNGKHKAVIVTKPIPPERIELAGIYNVVERLQ